MSRKRKDLSSIRNYNCLTKKHCFQHNEGSLAVQATNGIRLGTLNWESVALLRETFTNRGSQVKCPAGET
jgi:hypothetical protein